MPRPTRLQRFGVLRNAIEQRLAQRRRLRSASRELRVGGFRILYSRPGAYPGRGYNLQIWPYGHYDGGHWVYGNKVLNVDWDEAGNIDLLTYRGGPWEDDLFTLLTDDPIEQLARRQ